MMITSSQHQYFFLILFFIFGLQTIGSLSLSSTSSHQQDYITIIKQNQQQYKDVSIKARYLSDQKDVITDFNATLFSDPVDEGYDNIFVIGKEQNIRISDTILGVQDPPFIFVTGRLILTRCNVPAKIHNIVILEGGELVFEEGCKIDLVNRPPVLSLPSSSSIISFGSTISSNGSWVLSSQILHTTFEGSTCNINMAPDNSNYIYEFAKDANVIINIIETSSGQCPDSEEIFQLSNYNLIQVNSDFPAVIQFGGKINLTGLVLAINSAQLPSTIIYGENTNMSIDHSVLQYFGATTEGNLINAVNSSLSILNSFMVYPTRGAIIELGQPATYTNNIHSLMSSNNVYYGWDNIVAIHSDYCISGIESTGDLFYGSFNESFLNINCQTNNNYNQRQQQQQKLLFKSTTINTLPVEGGIVILSDTPPTNSLLTIFDNCSITNQIEINHSDSMMLVTNYNNNSILINNILPTTTGKQSISHSVLETSILETLSNAPSVSLNNVMVSSLGLSLVDHINFNRDQLNTVYNGSDLLPVYSQPFNSISTIEGDELQVMLIFRTTRQSYASDELIHCKLESQEESKELSIPVLQATGLGGACVFPLKLKSLNSSTLLNFTVTDGQTGSTIRFILPSIDVLPSSTEFVKTSITFGMQNTYNAYVWKNSVTPVNAQTPIGVISSLNGGNSRIVQVDLKVKTMYSSQSLDSLIPTIVKVSVNGEPSQIVIAKQGNLDLFTASTRIFSIRCNSNHTSPYFNLSISTSSNYIQFKSATVTSIGVIAHKLRGIKPVNINFIIGGASYVSLLVTATIIFRLMMYLKNKGWFIRKDRSNLKREKSNQGFKRRNFIMDFIRGRRKKRTEKDVDIEMVVPPKVQPNANIIIGNNDMDINSENLNLPNSTVQQTNQPSWRQQINNYHNNIEIDTIAKHIGKKLRYIQPSTLLDVTYISGGNGKSTHYSAKIRKEQANSVENETTTTTTTTSTISNNNDNDDLYQQVHIKSIPIAKKGEYKGSYITATIIREIDMMLLLLSAETKLPKLIGYFISDRTFIMVFEAITPPFISLREFMNQDNYDSVSIGTRLKVCQNIAKLLMEVHFSAIVHLGLTLDNIFVNPQDPNLPIQIVDFKCCQFINSFGSLNTPANPYESPYTRNLGILRTVYMDIHALGVITVELLTKVPPPKRKPGQETTDYPSQIITSLDGNKKGEALLQQLLILLNRCLSYSAMERPALEDVIHQLGRFIEKLENTSNLITVRKSTLKGQLNNFIKSLHIKTPSKTQDEDTNPYSNNGYLDDEEEEY